MGFFDKLLGGKKSADAENSDYRDGDVVACEKCAKRVTVKLQRVSGEAAFDADQLETIALSCQRCGYITCVACACPSGEGRLICPACQVQGGPSFFIPLERRKAKAEHERAVGIMDRGEYRPALELFKKALAATQNDPDPMNYLNIAVCHAHLGEFKQSLAVLEDAMRRWPDNARLRQNYAAIKREIR